MKKIIMLGIFLCSMLLYTRCGDEFIEKVDKTSINSGSFYNTEGDAIASVNAVYAHLQNISLWGRRIFFMLDFASDEIDPTGNTQGPPQELLLHTFGASGNEHIDNPWQMFYKAIARANITVGEVSEMDINQEIKDQVIGEAKFLRALCYFYVNALWNGGPLRTEENAVEINTPRSSADEIWTQIEADLTDAASKLPWVYDDESNKGRATKGAAKSLLGKAHLYQEDYGQAETQLMDVINNGPYYLIGGENDPGGATTTIDEAITKMRTNHKFGVKNNGEAVFEVQFKTGEGGLSWDSNSARARQEATVRPQEYGVDGFSFYNAKPSIELIDAFERIDPNDTTAKGNIDPRFQAFFFTEYDTLKKTEDGDPIPYSDILVGSGYAWKKYQMDVYVQNLGNASDNDVNHDVIRYADVILMAAEAKIMQNKVSEGINLINKIRKRADPTEAILPQLSTGLSQSDAMDALIHERRIELCGEQVRRTDLVRWGIADQFISGYQKGKHEYFPIPQAEIDANQAISEDNQNPGYN